MLCLVKCTQSTLTTRTMGNKYSSFETSADLSDADYQHAAARSSGCTKADDHFPAVVVNSCSEQEEYFTSYQPDIGFRVSLIDATNLPVEGNIWADIRLISPGFRTQVAKSRKRTGSHSVWKRTFLFGLRSKDAEENSSFFVRLMHGSNGGSASIGSFVISVKDILEANGRFLDLRIPLQSSQIYRFGGDVHIPSIRIAFEGCGKQFASTPCECACGGAGSRWRKLFSEPASAPHSSPLSPVEVRDMAKDCISVDRLHAIAFHQQCSCAELQEVSSPTASVGGKRKSVCEVSDTDSVTSSGSFRTANFQDSFRMSSLSLGEERERARKRKSISESFRGDRFPFGAVSVLTC